MDKHIRAIAITCAVITFFLMACLGCLCGLTPATACTRAILGAVVAYLTSSLAARAIVTIIINAITESAVRYSREEDRQ